MTEYTIKTSFALAINKEAGVKSVRLFSACKAALDQCKDSSSDVNEIYENAEIVPADLVEQVKRIDPCRRGDPGFIVSYEDIGCLWIRHDKSTNLEFLTRYLSEVLLESGLEECGFEHSTDCSDPHIGAFGGGTILVTKHRAVGFSTLWMLRILNRMLAERTDGLGTLKRMLAEHGDSAVPPWDPRRRRQHGGADIEANSMEVFRGLPFGFALPETDLEKFAKVRGWLEEALYAAGAVSGGGSGIGMGQADVDIELEGSATT